MSSSVVHLDGKTKSSWTCFYMDTKLLPHHSSCPKCCWNGASTLPILLSCGLSLPRSSPFWFTCHTVTAAPAQQQGHTAPPPRPRTFSSPSFLPSFVSHVGVLQGSWGKKEKGRCDGAKVGEGMERGNLLPLPPTTILKSEPSSSLLLRVVKGKFSHFTVSSLNWILGAAFKSGFKAETNWI